MVVEKDLHAAIKAQLMLMLAFMLQKNREWLDHSIRIIRPVLRKADVENIETEDETREVSIEA